MAVFGVHVILSGQRTHTYLRAHTMPVLYAAAPLSACSLKDTGQLAPSPWAGRLGRFPRGPIGTVASQPRVTDLHVYMRGDSN
jgi:hypothetical protein